MAPGCACAHNKDGSTTTMMCSLHCITDPCLTMSLVTGKRRKGTIRRGRCTNCGWAEQKPQAIACEMHVDCPAEATYIGSKGYVYCEAHGIARRGIERTRKMRAWEQRWIREGRGLPSYKPGPAPVTP